MDRTKAMEEGKLSPSSNPGKLQKSNQYIAITTRVNALLVQIKFTRSYSDVNSYSKRLTNPK